MFKQLILLVIIIALVESLRIIIPDDDQQSSTEHAVEPKHSIRSQYIYGYGIYDDYTGDQKRHQEISNGVEVRGRYSLVEPDGSLREVTYVADDANGFRAVVKSKHLLHPHPIAENTID